ncbi:hypothetical protein [Rhizohabitans arisaemae]|uniref:hypothetical protein n=1 Tax=Rhizohabitans arisaemae TaxID=2720610 RepID=UPI0024B0CDCD|nr:hypothetical protein [Rhizohabitans arisaemae]
MTGPASTEDQLREALEQLASGVRAHPDAYRRVQREWRRRERKRRIILAVVVTLVFALADAVGLWALNQSSQNSPQVVFNDPAPPQPSPPQRIPR